MRIATFRLDFDGMQTAMPRCGAASPSASIEIQSEGRIPSESVRINMFGQRRRIHTLRRCLYRNRQSRRLRIRCVCAANL